MRMPELWHNHDAHSEMLRGKRERAAVRRPVNCTTGPCGFVQDDDIALICLQGQNIAYGVLKADERALRLTPPR